MNYEYKVITRTPDPLNGGRFKAAKLEQILNYYAQDGWTVVSITTALTRAAFVGFRSQLIITLRRGK